MTKTVEALIEEVNPTDTEWDTGANIVLAWERFERNDPKWLPTFLNGGMRFTKRVLATIQKIRKGTD